MVGSVFAAVAAEARALVAFAAEVEVVAAEAPEAVAREVRLEAGVAGYACESAFTTSRDTGQLLSEQNNKK